MGLCSKLEKKVNCNLARTYETNAVKKQGYNFLSGRKISCKTMDWECMALVSRIIRLPVVILIFQPIRFVLFATSILTLRLIKPLNRANSHIPGLRDIVHTSHKIPRLFAGLISTVVFGIVLWPEVNFKIHRALRLLEKDPRKPEPKEATPIKNENILPPARASQQSLLKFLEKENPELVDKATPKTIGRWANIEVDTPIKRSLKDELNVGEEEIENDYGNSSFEYVANGEEMGEYEEEEDDELVYQIAVKRDCVVSNPNREISLPLASQPSSPAALLKQAQGQRTPMPFGDLNNRTYAQHIDAGTPVSEIISSSLQKGKGGFNLLSALTTPPKRTGVLRNNAGTHIQTVN